MQVLCACKYGHLIYNNMQTVDHWIKWLVTGLQEHPEVHVAEMWGSVCFTDILLFCIKQRVSCCVLD